MDSPEYLEGAADIAHLDGRFEMGTLDDPNDRDEKVDMMMDRGVDSFHGRIHTKNFEVDKSLRLEMNSSPVHLNSDCIDCCHIGVAVVAMSLAMATNDCQTGSRHGTRGHSYHVQDRRDQVVGASVRSDYLCPSGPSPILLRAEPHHGKVALQ